MTPHHDDDAGAGVQTFSFELDDDLVKVITVRQGDHTCNVNVRYGGDHLLHEEDHVLAVDSPVEIRRHDMGITVHARRRLLPFLTHRVVRQF